MNGHRTFPAHTVLPLPAFFLFAVLCLTAPASVSAADVSLHGFLQGNYSLGVSADTPDGGDFKLAEERFQGKAEINQEAFRLFLKGDVYYDHIDTSATVELREGYGDFTAGKWDLRAGRQVVTWGLGDLVFINDVFPKDYEAFFAGRPLEYLKKGVDGVKLGLYPDFAAFEILVIPFFEPNHFPDPTRFWRYDPMPAVTARRDTEPATSLDNTEAALRVYREIAGFDAAFYLYRGFSRQPAMRPDSATAPTRLTLFYPELAVYGASLQGRALDGVVSLETGYYDAREDRDGTDPMVPNSQIRYLVGYQHQVWEDFTVGLQYYGEYMINYDDYERTLPSGFPAERRVRQLASVRLTQLLLHQTLRLSFFVFHGLADEDYLLNPEVKYNITDAVWVAVGGNVFGGGKPWSQFGQFAADDNLYTQLRYEF